MTDTQPPPQCDHLVTSPLPGDPGYCPMCLREQLYETRAEVARLTARSACPFCSPPPTRTSAAFHAVARGVPTFSGEAQDKEQPT